MSGTCRPTVRCLLEDLASTVGDAAQRSALMSGALPDASIRLDEIDHPIIAAARSRYSTDTPPDRSELLRNVRDHMWAKCRHGERWRGIVLWSATERPWLCFAGWHEQGDPDDVYADFESRCTVGKKTDSSAFLPTEDDNLRLQAETLVRDRLDALDRLNALVVNTLLQAIASRDTEHNTDLPSGAQLVVCLATGEDDPSDEDWINDLYLQVTVDWSTGVGAEELVRVLDAVPGVAPSEWQADSAIHAGGEPRYYVMVDEDWAQRVVDAAEKHGAEALGTTPSLIVDDTNGLGHYATQSAVDRGYYEGQMLRSLCGRRFVPQHDPQDRPVCEECANTKAAFDLVRDVLREDT